MAAGRAVAREAFQEGPGSQVRVSPHSPSPRSWVAVLGLGSEFCFLPWMVTVAEPHDEICSLTSISIVSVPHAWSSADPGHQICPRLHANCPFCCASLRSIHALSCRGGDDPPSVGIGVGAFNSWLAPDLPPIYFRLSLLDFWCLLEWRASIRNPSVQRCTKVVRWASVIGFGLRGAQVEMH